MNDKPTNRHRNLRSLIRDEQQPAVRGEPIGWYTEDHLDDKSATTYNAEIAQRWRDKGWPVWSLYAAPHPAEQQQPEVERIKRDAATLLRAAAVVREGKQRNIGARGIDSHLEQAAVRLERIAEKVAQSVELFDDQGALTVESKSQTPDVSALVEIAKEIVELHDKRRVVLTVHVEALREALAAHRKQRPAPDITQLVEALESILPTLKMNNHRNCIYLAEKALAAYRKGGDE